MLASRVSIPHGDPSVNPPSLSHPQVSFLDKNNDTLQEDWLAQLASSEVPLLQSLFLPGIDAAAKANRKAASFSSVGKRFVNDLNSLLAELKTSKAHFVRCVKPSAASQPRAFEAPLVLDQLRCAGVVEAVRVMTEAYPTRIPYEVIHGRYAPLMGQEVLDCTGDEPAAFCEAVAQACDVAPRDYALGMTKLFLKAGCGGFLEDLASMDVAVVVPLLVRKIAESKRKKGEPRARRAHPRPGVRCRRGDRAPPEPRLPHARPHACHPLAICSTPTAPPSAHPPFLPFRR